MSSDPATLEAYHALCAYTLELRDAEFVHQQVVDAFFAQHADCATKPVGIAMALVGLYLHVDRGFTGREVQRVHMRLGRAKRGWPTFELPADRGVVTVQDVPRVPAGPDRLRAIHGWTVLVWGAYSGNREAAVEFLAHHAVVDPR